MANYPFPVKNVAYTLYLNLVSQASTFVFQANPTLAAGDVKVSIDGGAFANLATLPVVTPAGGKAVRVALSAGEMNGDNIEIVFSDAAGAEWCDLGVIIQTGTQGMSDLISLASALTVHDTSAITTSTVNDALLAARSQGGGAWSIVGTTITLKNPDGSTFRTFTLDSATAPTSRT